MSCNVSSFPSQSISMSFVPVVPLVSLRTLESFTLPSSSVRMMRFLFADTIWMSFRRYRVRSRSSRCSRGGMKLGFSNPAISNWHIHSLSFLSVLRPGTFFMCRAFTIQMCGR